MKAKEIIELLQEFDPETEVFVVAPDFADHALDEVLIVKSDRYKGNNIIIIV